MYSHVVFIPMRFYIFGREEKTWAIGLNDAVAFVI